MHKTIAACLLPLFVVTGSGSAPQNPDPVATAVDYIRHADFRRAYAVFAALARDATRGSPAWEEAIYGQAVCAEQISPPSAERSAEARRLYEQLLAEVPQGRLAPRAWMDLGRMAELTELRQTRQRLAEARACYERAVALRPDGPIAAEATLRIAATWIQTFETGDVRRGVRILRDWLAAHPDGPFASVMWQYLGQICFFPLASYEEALACYLEADRRGLLEPGRAGSVYWRMATMADRLLERRDVAVTYYTKIVTDAPTSGKAYEAQLALQRLKAPVPEIQLFDRRPVAAEGQGGP